MPDWVIAALAVGFTLAVLPVLTYLGAVGMCSLRLTELTKTSDYHREFEASRTDNEWATANGYEWIGAFRTSALMNPRAIVLAWQSPEAATFFCVYHVANQRHYDFVTQFERGVDVTTGSSAGSMLYPSRPDVYTQAFSNAPLNTLFERHLEAEEYVQSRLAVSHASIDEPFKEHFTHEVRAAMRHVRSIPLWPLRTYWWFATKGRRTNTPVAERFPDLAPAGPIAA